jgi:hypothetical protein
MNNDKRNDVNKMNKTTICERDNETTNALIIKFAHVLTTNDTNAKHAFARRIIAIYRNDESMRDVVRIARETLTRS